jgi:hypothetical protein
MLSRIKSKLGAAGLAASMIALVLAMGGGAYAAKGVIITKLNQISPSVQKRLKGRTGAPGPQGPAGPQGPKGDAGARGDTGTPGTNGQDGEDGACSTSTPSCVLPSKATLTGSWEFNDINLEVIWANVSFPLQVAPDLFGGTLPEYVAAGASGGTSCPGTAADPKAAPGHICLYEDVIENAVDSGVTLYSDGRSGFIRKFEAVDSTQRSYGRGTWAVTAP